MRKYGIDRENDYSNNSMGLWGNISARGWYFVYDKWSRSLIWRAEAGLINAAQVSGISSQYYIT
jgi:hypothetical protein